MNQGIFFILRTFLFCLILALPAVSLAGSSTEDAGITLYYTGNTWGYLEPCPS